MKAEVYFYEKGYRITNEGLIINPKGIEIQGYLSNSGYIRIGIGNKKCHIHRLQAYQKYGDLLFEVGIEVRHKNDIKLDNTFDNILIGTHSDNIMDRSDVIRFGRGKFDKQEVKDFHYTNGNSYKTTMSNFGISSKATLHFILNH